LREKFKTVSQKEILSLVDKYQTVRKLEIWLAALPLKPSRIALFPNSPSRSIGSHSAVHSRAREIEEVSDYWVDLKALRVRSDRILKVMRLVIEQ
jgi:hypothetical protein